MRELTPTTVDVLSTYLFSFGPVRPGEEEPSRRRTHLGLFDADKVTPEEIKKALQNNREALKPVIGLRSYMGKAPANVRIESKKIEEGVIFESVDECVTYLEHGLTYEDICDGYRLRTNEETVIELSEEKYVGI